MIPVDLEQRKRFRRLDAIQAKFDAEGQPVTRLTIPVVLGNVVCKTRMIELAHDALTTGELPREVS